MELSPFPSSLLLLESKEREIIKPITAIRTRPNPNPPFHQIQMCRPKPSSSSPTSHPMNGSSSSSSFGGFGVRVSVKPDYRLASPPQLSPKFRNIPQSTFLFDFELERKILAEAEKERQNLSRLGLEDIASKTTETASSLGSVPDPVVGKYLALGLSREAVPLAVANYGDNPIKVREFVHGYTLLLEMGFASDNVAEALVMFDNDADKALAHLLNSSS